MTDKQEAFIREYLVDLNATQAAIRAGYSARNADKIGPELLGKTRVAARIAELQAGRAGRLQLKADDALRLLWDVARADPNELVEYRRTCCRCCHGKGHRHQRTLAEMARRTKKWQAEVEKAQRANKPRPDPFDDEGGVGYDPRRPPHPECPECLGEGIGRAFVKDTRGLSPEARALYAGVRETREGVEVKMHDQLAARVSVGKHLGLFKDAGGDAAGNHVHIHLEAAELRKLPPDELRRIYREALRAPESAADEAAANP